MVHPWSRFGGKAKSIRHGQNSLLDGVSAAEMFPVSLWSHCLLALKTRQSKNCSAILRNMLHFQLDLLCSPQGSCQAAWGYFLSTAHSVDWSTSSLCSSAAPCPSALCSHPCALLLVAWIHSSHLLPWWLSGQNPNTAMREA